MKRIGVYTSGGNALAGQLVEAEGCGSCSLEAGFDSGDLVSGGGFSQIG